MLNTAIILSFRNWFPGCPVTGFWQCFAARLKNILSSPLVLLKRKALSILFRHFVKGQNPASDQVIMAMEDSYQRLLAPSLETDIRQEVKERADAEAIRVFAQNLHELLMAPPLGQKTVLAIDPGFRTGCKVVCLDPQGKLLHNTTIYPTLSPDKRRKPEKYFLIWLKQYKVEAIAIGNGTAGRETEAFIRGLNLPDSICGGHGK